MSTEFALVGDVHLHNITARQQFHCLSAACLSLC